MATKRSRVFDSYPEMDIRQGIAETAAALGMDPIDLATIISYETGGTFDPMQAGPITKWGQHRGLIQFGEPQAKQYGVNWSDPLRSQLGPKGAIVNYFQGSGWKPGMGMLDAYSIVNAGGPGKYNASDTAAGGAPGTVRDKVEQQMGGHREKAVQLLGGPAVTPPAAGPTPQPTGGPPVTPPAAGPLPDIGKPPPTPAAKPGWKGAAAKFGDAMASGEGMGEIKGTTVPDLPRAALFQSQPTVVGDPQEVELRRKKLAEIMARLNTGKLTI